MAFAIKSDPVAVEEYLGSCYKPDRDFVNGELQERNLGEREHSEMQLAILLWFASHSAEWAVVPLPEIRVQTTPENFRIADIAIVAADAPREKILFSPPQIVIEILSPEDRVYRYEERLEEYRRMGVPAIWVIDPIGRIGFNCSTGNWIKTTRLETGNSGIHLSIPELPLLR
jgi:Uma2 family endonuclease